MTVIDAAKLAAALEAAEALRPVSGDKATDALISKLKEAQRVSAFGEIGQAVHEALATDPAALTPPKGSGSMTVFGSRSFGLGPITLPDGRKVRWNVQVTLDGPAA